MNTTTVSKLAAVVALIGFSEARAGAKNGAARRRVDAAERAYAISALGMKAEPAGVGPFHADAYCASTGELITWVRQAVEGVR